jgi:anti-sigma regulatory factor (Ser/Thr protein kinase)
MHSIRFSINSDAHQATLLGQCLETLCRQYTPFEQGLIEDIQLCILEIVQQIINDNQYATNAQSISVTLALETDKLMVDIEDQGRGFNENLLQVILQSATVLDPLYMDQTLPDQAFRFFLLKMTMDKISYRNDEQRHILHLEKNFKVLNSKDNSEIHLGKSNRQREWLAV